MSIDWGRMGEPQEDEYDSGVYLLRAKERFGYEPSEEEGLGFFCGTVPLRRITRLPESSMVVPPMDHRGILGAEEMIALDPLLLRQCRALLDGIYPVVDAQWLDDPGPPGCSCGGITDQWGHVFATCADPLGFAEGIVHEMGHWKLHALGIDLLRWPGGLIGNDPKELYESPIRKDMPRPMGAVLHAQYSYLHVVQLQTAVCRSDEKLRKVYGGWLLYNAKRLEGGAITLAEHFKPAGPDGEAFFEGIQLWQDRVIQDAMEVVR